MRMAVTYSLGVISQSTGNTKRGGNPVLKDFRGLSTDEKPTDNLANGSTFYETDTREMYLFNAVNGVWKIENEKNAIPMREK